MVCLFLCWNPEGKGQSSPSLFETLYGLDEVSITLTYPFDSLYRSNREEIDAQITIQSKEGVLIKNEKITINLRGKFRRMKCSMPPLLLNFKKSTLRNLNLDNIDEVKLVTHCLDTPEGEENLQEELMCYRMYESLTTSYYRTIWLNVTYEDALRVGETIKSTGFLLEPDKDITKRLGFIERKLFNPAEDSIHFDSYSHAVAYNFLIGNRDWSIVMSRNAKLFYDSISTDYVVIPYDFDYSNIVSATYRRETRPENMNHPLERIYQGEYFASRSGEIIKKFQESQDIILNSVATAPNPMGESERKKIAKYLETWYAQVKKTNAKDLPYGYIVHYKGGL
jgi:hypothetical protein